MADNTHIEWTNTTWNPIVGCSLASPGCTNCYAMRTAGTRLAHLPKYDGLTQPSKAGPVWTGKLVLAEKALLEPLRWKTPRMVFVNSMGDLFHEDCPDEWIDQVFAVMALCPQHTFQVLTNRSARMREFLSKPFFRRRVQLHCAEIGLQITGKRMSDQAAEEAEEFVALSTEQWPLPNVWLGVSVEDQQRADERIPDLLATPAAIRWISAEPLLRPVDLTKPFYRHSTGYEMQGYLRDKAEHDDFRYWAEKLDWVVAGGESGKHARPMHPDWVRSLRDQCAAAEVPFFFKQWGEWAPEPDVGRSFEEHRARGARDLMIMKPDLQGMELVGKKRAGRLLDGVEHNAMPQR